jgi:hypothetical protein
VRYAVQACQAGHLQHSMNREGKQISPQVVPTFSSRCRKGYLPQKALTKLTWGAKQAFRCDA